MSWTDPLLDQLADAPLCGYRNRGKSASEPTALAALALFGHGRTAAAVQAADALAELQQAEGSLGISPTETAPRWPTGLAVLAWSTIDPLGRYQQNIEKAISWLLSFRGKTIPSNPSVQHDTSLAAWPWVEGTHSWIEPTAIGLLALKAADQAQHPRAKEAVRLLLDRQLPSGGCNYGNTFVLGQALLPHVQPTGLAMLALRDEQDPSGQITRSLHYLAKALSAETTSASLAWGLLGLAAHNQSPASADQWLSAAASRTRKRDRSPYKAALLALAALGEKSPLMALPKRSLAT